MNFNNPIIFSAENTPEDITNREIVRKTLVVSRNGLYAVIGIIIENPYIMDSYGDVEIYHKDKNNWKKIHQLDFNDSRPSWDYSFTSFGGGVAISDDGKRLAVSDSINDVVYI